MGHTWENGSHCEKFETFGKTNHTVLNGSCCENWITLGNIDHTEKIVTSQKWVMITGENGWHLDKCVTLRKFELTQPVCDLGVNLDKSLSLTPHKNKTCKKAINAIWFISRIRKYLSKENFKLLVNALVISLLDYCNGILYGLTKQELDKLQRTQNTAAHLINET